MDRLDKITIALIMVLMISALVLAGGYKSEAGPARELQKRKASSDYTAINIDVVNKVKAIKNLMESNNLLKAEILVKELIQKYPYEGDPHMLMGDIFMRKQALLQAMPEYKEAIDLNPDYLDKKTPLFQGKKLKVAARDALTEIEKMIEADSGNIALKQQMKIIYYLERRIAGSCG